MRAKGLGDRFRGVAGLAVLASALIVDPAAAQASKAMQQAAELGQEAKWEEAIEVLEKAVEGEDRDNAAAWFQLARTYEQVERWSDVVTAASTALDKGFQRTPLAHLAMARAYAEQGKSEAALAEVEAAASGGANRFLLRALEDASSLEGLRDDPRFGKAVANLTPCTSEPYRQFDFWLGDFRVENQAGTVVGENEITLQLDGCMLMESWKGASGVNGMSFNFYDPSDQTWNQIFVDNNGKPGNWPPLKGKLEEDGSMVLWSPEGESRTRWTWKKVDEGKVRQTAEQTTDGGETWRVTWDSYYVQKPGS